MSCHSPRLRLPFGFSFSLSTFVDLFDSLLYLARRLITPSVTATINYGLQTLLQVLLLPAIEIGMSVLF
jgi:hypothetical protein